MSPETASLQLRRRRLVLEGSAIAPLTVSSRLLAGLKIIPPDVEPAREATTPAGAFLDYSDQFRVICQPGKLILSEPSSKSAAEPRIYAIAAKFVSAFSIPDYDSLELSWRLSVERDDAHAWLFKTFTSGLPQQFVPRVSQVNPWLIVPTSLADCHLRMNPGQTDTEEPKDVVEMESSFYHEGPLNVSNLRTRIDDWPAREKELTEILKAIGLA